MLAAHESFHRLLLRATDPDPVRRFDSADEMADQLAGVLREVLALGRRRTRGPAPSTVFGPARGTFAAGLLIGATAAPGRPDPARVAARAAGAAGRPGRRGGRAAGHRHRRRPRGGAAGWSTPPRSRARSCGCGWSAPTSRPATRPRPARCSTSWPPRTRTTGGSDWYRGDRRPASPATPDGGDQPLRRGLHRAARRGRAEAGARRRGRVRGPGRGRPGAATALVARIDREPGGRRVRAGPGPHPHRRPGRRAARARRRAGLVEPVRGRAARRRAGHRCSARRRRDRRGRRCARPRPGWNGCRSTRPPTRRCAPRLLERRGRRGRRRPAPATADPFLGCPWAERELRLALERCLRTVGPADLRPGTRIALVDRANAVRPRTWV